MFNNGYALSVKHEGEHLREKKVQVSGKEQRQVFLPFNSQYSLFLKNKTDRRAMFTVKLDGKLIAPKSTKFIIAAHSSYEIERFMLDGDLNQGEKFKFVDVNKSGEEPGLKENGLLEVKVYPEKRNIFFGSSILRSKGLGDSSSHTVNSNQATLCSTSQLEEGVTVGGDSSDQAFEIGQTFYTEDDPIVLTLKLLPTIQLENEVCIGCEGKKVQTNNQGVKVLCPVCDGTAVMPVVTL